MKQKINITIEKEKLEQIKELLKDSKFRNHSHVFEYALSRLLKEEIKND